MSLTKAEKSTGDAPKKAAAEKEAAPAGPQNAAASPSNTKSLLAAQREEQAPTAEKKSSGLSNYEATLGKWLGPKLYSAVKKELTQAKLAKIADSTMKGALKSLGNKVGELDSDVSPADVDALVKALQKEFGTVAGTWVKNQGAGLTSALNGFVDANPELIVTIALLAAAGAVAADMKLPELSKKLGLGAGFSAEAGVQLGTIQHLALKQIEAKLSYESKKLKAQWVGTFDDDDGLSTKFNLRYQAGKDTTLGAFGQWSEKEGAAGGVNLDYKPNDRLSIGAYGKMSEKKGAEAGVGIKWRF
jgi:hypothetical protein